MSILRTGTATFKGAHVNTKESKQGCFDDTILAVCFVGNAGLVSRYTFQLHPIDIRLIKAFHIYRGRIYV